MIKSIFSVFLALSFFVPWVAFAQDQYQTDCEKFPNSLACIPVGEAPANEEIPTQSKNLSIQNGPVFAGGGCPADVSVNIIGRQLTIISMSRPCSWIVDYMKPIILLLASFAAVFIVLPMES